MSERVFIIGAGKVGRGLANAFRAAHVNVVGIHARTPREGATSSGALPSTTAGEANVILVAVGDEGLNAVCLDVAAAASGKHPIVEHGTVLLHTSGIKTPDALFRLREAGVPCGTFHPLVPFPTAERGATALRDGWVGIDGDATACAAARRLAAALGARTVNIPPNAKAAYHAAAVMASNFPVVLAGIASALLTRKGVEQHTAEQIVERLMAAAVANLAHGASSAVLTGPAARADTATIAAHRQALRDDADALTAYDALTRAAAALLAPDRGACPRIDDTDVGGRRELEG